MTAKGKCPIWGTQADVTDDVDTEVVDSPRAGGKYRVSGTAKTMLADCSEQLKLQLTDWLIEQRNRDTCPEITSNIVKAVKSRSIMAPPERLNAIFKYIGTQLEEIGSELTYSSQSGFGNVEYQKLLAHGRCTKQHELQFLMDTLTELGFIKSTSDQIGADCFQLTMKGYSRLTQLNNG